MKTQILLAFVIMILIRMSGFSQNNVTITDNTSHNADESSVLDVYSTSKGMLVPRMSIDQINLISDPATGLLVFNTDENSFWFYNGAAWDDLSSGSAGLWDINPATGEVYLKNLSTNVGIGTNDPIGKLSIKGNSGGNPDNPLFEVSDEFGNPVFSVTSEGVRVYIKAYAKGASGGFAVGKYGIAKDIPDTTFLLVTPDSTRVYTSQFAKGASGGFAVGKYGIAKGLSQNFLQLNENNYFIGHQAGENITTGLYNVFLGYQSGLLDTSGGYNTFVGYKSGLNNSDGLNNVFLGYLSGTNNTTGDNNIFLGVSSGIANETGINNIYIGTQAGPMNHTGNNNIFIGNTAGANETGSNKLYIDIEGQNSQNAMIYGDFAADNLRLNGLVTIGNFFNLDTENMYPTPGVTLNPTRSCVRFSNAGPISLNSTTAIADGKEIGQILVLLGSDETKTVTVPNNANTMLTGTIILDFGDVLMLIWDGYDWRELSYTNM
jgi:trimeric autotransporter adhesin